MSVKGYRTKEGSMCYPWGRKTRDAWIQMWRQARKHCRTQKPNLGKQETGNILPHCKSISVGKQPLLSCSHSLLQKDSQSLGPSIHPHMFYHLLYQILYNKYNKYYIGYHMLFGLTKNLVLEVGWKVTHQTQAFFIPSVLPKPQS